MLELFKFRKGIKPFAYLPQSAVKTIKGDELLLVISKTSYFVCIDDNKGNGNKYGVPRSAGTISKLEISL